MWLPHPRSQTHLTSLLQLGKRCKAPYATCFLYLCETAVSVLLCKFGTTRVSICDKSAAHNQLACSGLWCGPLILLRVAGEPSATDAASRTAGEPADLAHSGLLAQAACSMADFLPSAAGVDHAKGGGQEPLADDPGRRQARSRGTSLLYGAVTCWLWQQPLAGDHS